MELELLNSCCLNMEIILDYLHRPYVQSQGSLNGNDASRRVSISDTI